MKNLICIDSSTHQASLAFFQDGKFLSEEISLVQRSHSEFVTIALEKISQDQAVPIKSIDGIAVTVGPGSFTGIRVAIGMAKALGYSNKIPIWTTNSLNVLRTQVAEERSCFASLNAYKNLVFGAYFEKDQISAEPSVYSYEAAALLLDKKSKNSQVHLIGEGTDLFTDLISSQIEMKLLCRESTEQLPRAKWLGELYFESPSSGQTLDWKLINPLYLRGSEAEENHKIHSSENS